MENVYDPAATTYTLVGNSLADPNGIVRLIYKDINITRYFLNQGEPVSGEMTAACSVNTPSGFALTCFPYLPALPNAQFSPILYRSSIACTLQLRLNLHCPASLLEIMVAQNVTSCRVDVQYSQLSQREYTPTVPFATVTIPAASPCSSIMPSGLCSRAILSGATEVTITGSQFGSSVDGVKVLFKPSGGCVVKNVTNSEIICQVIGTLAQGQNLLVAVFAREAPEVVAAWISYTTLPPPPPRSRCPLRSLTMLFRCSRL